MSHLHGVLAGDYGHVDRPALRPRAYGIAESLVTDPNFDYLDAEDPRPFVSTFGGAARDAASRVRSRLSSAVLVRTGRGEWRSGGCRPDETNGRLPGVAPAPSRDPRSSRTARPVRTAATVASAYAVRNEAKSAGSTEAVRARGPGETRP